MERADEFNLVEALDVAIHLHRRVQKIRLEYKIESESYEIREYRRTDRAQRRLQFQRALTELVHAEVNALEGSDI
jgi:hypothetical protein